MTRCALSRTIHAGTQSEFPCVDGVEFPRVVGVFRCERRLRPSLRSSKSHLFASPVGSRGSRENRQPAPHDYRKFPRPGALAGRSLRHADRRRRRHGRLHAGYARSRMGSCALEPGKIQHPAGVQFNRAPPPRVSHPPSTSQASFQAPGQGPLDLPDLAQQNAGARQDRRDCRGYRDCVQTRFTSGTSVPGPRDAGLGGGRQRQRPNQDHRL